MRAVLTFMIVATAALALNAGSALATTAQVVPDSPNSLVITGDPGNNDIEVHLQPNVVTVEVTDSDAPVTPLSGCSPGANSNAVICTVWEVNGLRVDTGAGEDRFTSFTADTANNAPFDPFYGHYDILGGDGDDYLSGGTGAYGGGDGSDQIYGAGTIDAGSDGGDDIVGLTGQSTVHTGPGNDTVDETGSYGNDSLDLGSGSDLVTYDGRAAKIKADLRTGKAGQTKERDILMGVEDLGGGANNDTLYGNDGANHLRGYAGSDKLIALGGNDELDAGPGKHDTLDGGTGDDLFHARDGETIGSDLIKCRQGLDSYEIDPKDHITKDCETALP